MKTIIYIATSLDGFIARKDGSIDWLNNIENPTNEDYGYNEFIKKIDAIVIGRGTYEFVLNFPGWHYQKKVFLLSTTIKSVPDILREKLTLLSMAPKEIISYLSKSGYSNIYIDGGKTIQKFLKEDLIDEMIITRIPVLIGSGIPLFGYLDKDINFKHIETSAYTNGLVKSHYERKRD
ncbi:MAG: dihydrofolate reductase [bacterium]|nr:MAG: dihydrofolate reductase [bacterium]